MNDGNNSLTLLSSGPTISVSPSNSDISVHVDEKSVRLAVSSFSSVSRSSLNLKSCVFVGSFSTPSSASSIDVTANRYDPGYIKPTSLFPVSTVSLGQDDVEIPCFLNRRISKSELKHLSLSTLFPPLHEYGFSPSLRDIVACCISLRLSAVSESPRATSPAVVTRADLRISLPTNVVSFTPVSMPPRLFGGLGVSDLLPPVLSTGSRQSFRAGFISLRAGSNRLASSMGFLLESDVFKQPSTSGASLAGIWISGSNNTPAEDMRIYAACMRYAFDTQLAKQRVLPSLMANHRTPPSMPFTSSQPTPFFLLAIVNAFPRHSATVSFYECRISPTLQPTFTILTATTLLPPPSVHGIQTLRLDFILGRAASAVVGAEESKRLSLDDSGEEQTFDAEDDEPPSALNSFRRKSAPQPQPQPKPNFAMPSVPDVSVWLPPPGPSANTPRNLSTPRNFLQMPISEVKQTTNKSSVASVSDFEDEWRAMRQKVEVMWHSNNSNGHPPPKLSSTMISQTTTTSASIEAASVIVSPPQLVRTSVISANTKISEMSDNSTRTLRDACVGVGTSLLVLNSPKKSRAVISNKTTEREIDQHLSTPVVSRLSSEANLLPPPSSDTCSQCNRESAPTHHVEIAKSTGCCLFPKKDSKSPSEAKYSMKEKQNLSKIKKPNESFVGPEDPQHDPCSLILKWLQRCGNETATSSICEEAIFEPDNQSHYSSNYDENIKTATAICKYLNGDATIRQSHPNSDSESEEEEDDHENQYSSRSGSSLSVVLKTDGKPVSKSNRYLTVETGSSSWTNMDVNASQVTEKVTENVDSFAARAREIVRQMDEWGLAPKVPVKKDDQDYAANSQINQNKLFIEDPRPVTDQSVFSSINSVSSRHSNSKGIPKLSSSNTRTVDDVNVSVALPRIVALDSLRLGPTDTTLVMKNLASKHLNTLNVKQSYDDEDDEFNDSYRLPTKAAAVKYKGTFR